MSFNVTAKQCPSFVGLFKNSYLLRAPQDIVFTSPEKGSKVMFAEESNGSPFHFQSVTSHNISAQMNPEFSEIYTSVKIGFNLTLCPEVPTQMMFLDPCYHLDKKSELQTLTGAMELREDSLLPFNVNMALPHSAFDEKHVCRVYRNQPLAYLYFPMGKPTIKTKECTPEELSTKYLRHRTEFHSDWIHSKHEHNERLKI
jgi:hypothetical protein